MLRRRSIQIAASGVMAAFVCVGTLLIQIPNPPTKGYINIGDGMIMVSALTFGMWVGAFAGGVGAALADLLSPFAFYAPYTLIIKGIEGLLAGWISGKGSAISAPRMIIAWIIGAGEMVIGYFVVQTVLFGVGAALTEVPGNLFQLAVGGIVGIPVTLVLKRQILAEK